MKISETLTRDPARHSLANNGQARITDLADERAIEELRAELETFVCDGQYGEAIRRILDSYVKQFGRPRQNSAWVSGFFGSGKSHLLKMLGHLWANTDLGDGVTARSLVVGLSDEIEALFRELDIKSRQVGRPLVAAFGALPQGSNETVRLTVLSVILRSIGMPDQYPQARFCFWLRDRGFLEQVRADVEKAGKVWAKELGFLYSSPLIANAVLRADPNFAADERSARQTLRSQFPDLNRDLTTEEFVSAFKEALAPDGQDLPLTMLILDEAQLYIGDSIDRATVFTEMAEAIQTQMDSRVLLAVSGQSALSSQTQTLGRIKDRFTINVQLSDTDVEAVIRKVILEKKPSAVDSVKAVLTSNEGEVAKQLTGTKIGPRPEDRGDFVADYPLLPVRRRFWEECFRRVDTAGTQSQLRSQLRIVHDALTRVAADPLGHTITADALYDAIAPDLVTKGVLLNELNNRIAGLEDGTDRGRLRKSLCGLVFLISKLPREGGADVGVRANATVLADLLVKDISADNGSFRHKIEQELEALASDGTLMLLGDEYRLQTTEGAEWDRSYRQQMAYLRANPGDAIDRREQLFATAVQDAIRGVKLTHGQSKLKRELELHIGSQTPPDAGDITVWLRDGWSCKRKEVEDTARKHGNESSTVYVFIEKKAADELEDRIIRTLAAKQVLDANGHPTTDEGKEAKESMSTRLLSASNDLEALINDLLTGSHVFKGGGGEVQGLSLVAKLEEAARVSLARKYPRFEEADFPAERWETVRKRAINGDDTPFSVVQHAGPAETHAVCREVSEIVGAGRSGSDVRKQLQAAPYGWSKDAIDAALVSLVREGVLRASSNGQPVAIAQLDQNRIPKTEFRVESTKLSTTDKMVVRQLYSKVGVSGKPGEEEVNATAFLDKLLDIASRSGGDAPLPPAPNTQYIRDIKQKTGNERLAALVAQKDRIEADIDLWNRQAELAGQRTPKWHTLQSMLEMAAALPVAAKVGPEAEAIRSSRNLLDKTDYVTPLLKQVEDALREAVKQSHAAALRVHEREGDGLDASKAWTELDRAQRERIAQAAGLQPIPELDIATQDKLLASLRNRPLSSWAELADGLPTRFANAKAAAAKELEPKTQIVKLKSDALTDEAAVKDWLAGVEKHLVEKLKHGPVVVFS